MEVFAKRLKELRLEKGLSQVALAKALNGEVTASAIGLWELNKRVPNVEAVVKLALYFKVSTDFLLGLTEE